VNNMTPDQIKKEYRKQQLIKEAMRILDRIEATLESWDKQIKEKRLQQAK